MTLRGFAIIDLKNKLSIQERDDYSKLKLFWDERIRNLNKNCKSGYKIQIYSVDRKYSDSGCEDRTGRREVDLELYVPGVTAADRLSTAVLFSRLLSRRCTKYRFNHSEFILPAAIGNKINFKIRIQMIRIHKIKYQREHNLQDKCRRSLAGSMILSGKTRWILKAVRKPQT